MEDCLFCKIASGDIPSQKIYEDKYVYAFKDIAPQSPFHAIIIPKEHISCANDINSDNSVQIAHVFEAISKIAKHENLKNGYRIINNCGEDAGQTVFHIHFHMLAGKSMGEKII